MEAGSTCQDLKTTEKGPYDHDWSFEACATPVCDLLPTVTLKNKFRGSTSFSGVITFASGSTTSYTVGPGENIEIPITTGTKVQTIIAKAGLDSIFPGTCMTFNGPTDAVKFKIDYYPDPKGCRVFMS